MYNNLDWSEVLSVLSQFAHSEKAKSLLQKTEPLNSATLAQEQCESVLQASRLLQAHDSPYLKALDSIDPVISRLSIRATLSTKELLSTREFLNASIALKNYLKSHRNPWSDMAQSEIADLLPILSRVDHVISPDGEILENASPELSSLLRESRDLKSQITKTMDQIVARRQMEPVLQDKYVTNRDGRMVIPVKSGNQHDIKGIIHDASHSKMTVFMEPQEVIPMNNRLREVQILIQEEIERILAELSRYLSSHLVSFENAAKAMLTCDAMFSRGRFAIRIKANGFQFSENGLTLKGLKHPLLVFKGGEVIANDVLLDENHRILLLTGPNAGGKTVLLKAIGLSAQMARCGLPISVQDGSTLPFFNEVCPIIGDLQSVDHDLSSFSSHLLRLKDSVKFASPGALILVDEICGATDPEEGSALARAIIDEYVSRKCFAVVTSHLGPLKKGWSEVKSLIHGSLDYDTRTNKPTFHLLLGVPGKSLAIMMAKRLGLPEEIVDRATKYLSPESRKQTEELEEVENLKSQLLNLRELAEKNLVEAQRQKQVYTDLVQKFRSDRDRWMDKTIRKTETKIENLIEETRQGRLKQKTLHDLKGELPEIVKTPATPRAQTLDEFKSQFKPGTPAFSTRLGRKVVIQGEPDSHGQVQVLADSMRISLPWHSLTQGEGKSEPVKVSPGFPQLIKRTSGETPHELDLRGERVDDAIENLTKWLDRCLQSGHDRVKVIHGFGTEQLKKAIRRELSKSDAVKSWKPGDDTTGGDGITWIDLAD